MRVRSVTAREFFDSLSLDQWGELRNRLRHFTYKKYGWLSKHIRGLNLDEIVLDAIEDTYFGIRQWPLEENRNKDVSMFVFLCQTIRSKVSHLVEQENKKLPINDILDEGRPESLSHIRQIVLKSNEQSDQQAIYNALCRLIIESVRSDPILTMIAKYCVENPDSKPKEIAADLGLPIAEVRNAQKRFCRKALEARQKWGHEL